MANDQDMPGFEIRPPDAKPAMQNAARDEPDDISSDESAENQEAKGSLLSALSAGVNQSLQHAAQAVGVAPETQPDASAIAVEDRVRRLKSQFDRDRRLQKQLMVLAGVIVMAFVGFIYLPTARRLQELGRRLTTDAAVLEAERVRANRLPLVQIAANELGQHLDAFKPIPGYVDHTGFLLATSDIAERLKLRKLHTEPLPEVLTTSRLRTQPVRLSFEGDFMNVFKFLRHVEQMPRLLRVQELEIQSLGVNQRNAVQASGEVKVSMTVNLFYRPDAMPMPEEGGSLFGADNAAALMPLAR